jgi:hypothetical protein
MASDKKAPRNFTGLLDDVPTPGTKPVAGKADKPEKGPLLTFYIDKDLKALLDRVVYHSGRNSSQRAVINKALRQLLSQDPKALRPIPDEE